MSSFSAYLVITLKSTKKNYIHTFIHKRTLYTRLFFVIINLKKLSRLAELSLAQMESVAVEVYVS